MQRTEAAVTAEDAIAMLGSKMIFHNNALLEIIDDRFALLDKLHVY